MTQMSTFPYQHPRSPCTDTTQWPNNSHTYPKSSALVIQLLVMAALRVITSGSKPICCLIARSSNALPGRLVGWQLATPRRRG